MYLRADGTFTHDLAEAVIIRNVSEALHFCRTHELRGMDILMKFGKDAYDIRLEIGDPAQ